MMKKLFLQCLCLSFLSIGCAQSLTRTTEHKIDDLFSTVDENTPGYSIAVIKDGDYLLKRSYGLANLEYGIPISEHSNFNIASLSKQFTAAAIALLILENKISLEDKVSQYFDDFPFAESDMRIKHLIYMTSGINDYYYNERNNGMDWSTLHFFNIDTAIQASFGSRELMYVPGSQWSYSNINYMLLTKIVQQVSGMSFAKFIRIKIFEPLGMEYSIVNDDIFQVIPNRVNGYNYRNEENTSHLIDQGYLKSENTGFLQINRNAPHYGGSGVFSSIHDLKKWMDNFENKVFGGADFYNLMHQTMKFDHSKSNDAFGLAFGDFNGHEIVWYEGGDWGFSSYFMRFVKEDVSVIILSNLGTGSAQKYCHQLIDILIEDQVIIFE